MTAPERSPPGWRVQIRNLRSTLALVWTTDPRRAALLAAMSLIQASLPAATLWICKLLLDAVALAVTDGFASPSEAFARLTSDEAVKEMRKRFDASPHQAVAIMGRPKEKEGSGWADPHKLVDRGEHLFGKRGFFAKLRTQQAADTVLSKELDVQFCNCRARPANASTTSVKDAPRYTSG